jgi:putative membrane protein
MNSPAHRKFLFSRAAVLLGCITGAGLITSAEARLRPPVATFASVARGSELDPTGIDLLRPGERVFVQQIGELTRAEWRLAKLAVTQASGAAVRDFAQQLAADYGQINDSLAGLVRKKGVPVAPSATNTAATTAAYDELAARTGVDFDRSFLRTSLAAQEEMVKLYDEALADAKDADVREFAGTFRPVLRGHLNKLKELQKTLE